MFIDQELITNILEETKNPTVEESRRVIEKAKRRENLD